MQLLSAYPLQGHVDPEATLTQPRNKPADSRDGIPVQAEHLRVSRVSSVCQIVG